MIKLIKAYVATISQNVFKSVGPNLGLESLRSFFRKVVVEWLSSVEKKDK